MFRGLLLLTGLASLASGLMVMGPFSSSSSSHPRGVVVDHPSSHSEGLTTTSRRAFLGGMLLISAPLLSSSSAALAFDNKISSKYDDRPKRRGPKVGNTHCLDDTELLGVLHALL